MCKSQIEVTYEWLKLFGQAMVLFGRCTPEGDGTRDEQSIERILDAALKMLDKGKEKK